MTSGNSRERFQKQVKALLKGQSSHGDNLFVGSPVASRCALTGIDRGIGYHLCPALHWRRKEDFRGFGLNHHAMCAPISNIPEAVPQSSNRIRARIYAL